MIYCWMRQNPVFLATMLLSFNDVLAIIASYETVAMLYLYHT